MPAHPVPDSVIARSVAAYQAAVQAGALPRGVHVGIGKRSAVFVAAAALKIPMQTLKRHLDAVPLRQASYEPVPWTYPREHRLELRNATVMVAGDLHFWPNARVPLSPIKYAFRQVAHELQPAAIVMNGDLIDGTRISRHPKLRGQNPPKIIDEVQAASDFLLSLPEVQHRVVTMSNHDVRIDDYLANQAPDLEDMCPRMIDRLPGWSMAYAAVINGNTEIRHETGSGGIHARHNNATRTGWTIVTNHTHQLGVAPVYTRRGVHWGIECGMLAHGFEPMFEYTWGRPTRWQAGFVVLTYDDEGRLMPPETCEWLDNRAIFRGRVIDIKPRYRVKAA